MHVGLQLYTLSILLVSTFIKCIVVTIVAIYWVVSKFTTLKFTYCIPWPSTNSLYLLYMSARHTHPTDLGQELAGARIGLVAEGHMA